MECSSISVAGRIGGHSATKLIKVPKCHQTRRQVACRADVERNGSGRGDSGTGAADDERKDAWSEWSTT